MSINSNKRKKQGFTLVEILAVILVIGLLFVMLVPRLSSMDEASRQAGVKTKFKEFQNAATSLMLENAGLTKVMSSGTDVVGLVIALNKELDDANKFDSSTIQGQYCDSNAVDPWNNHYRLHVNDNTITFISYGSNPVTVHAAEFDYAAENCKYTVGITYKDGLVTANTQGFTVNLEEDTGNDGEGDNQIASTREDCFTWSGTTITGFSTSCGHTDAEHSSIVIPDRCTAIGNNAFQGCTSLTSITIPDSVTSIGLAVFYQCSNLTRITIPNSIASIGSNEFRGCTSLASITIPNSVTKIDGSAFYGCTSLTSITIPDSVTSIGSNVFYNCTSLTSVTIPNSVTRIGSYAFYNCTSLTSVTIPNSVTLIGSDAFSNCTSLASITIPNSVTKIFDWTFQGCTSLTSVTIPNSVTEIWRGAFQGCTRLTSVTIPNSVTSIGDNAFRNVPHIEYHGTASGRPWGALSMN